MTKAALGIAALGLLGAFWAFSERIFFAMSWKDMGESGAEIASYLRADLASGKTHLIPTGVPCVKEPVALDLSFHLTGYLPQGDDVVMRVGVVGGQAQFEQVYLGAVTPTVRADAAPLCLDRADPLTDTDEDAFAYLTVTFYDLGRNTFQTFGSEDAAPIFAWQDVAVDLLERPEESRSQGVTRLRLSPAL